MYHVHVSIKFVHFEVKVKENINTFSEKT